MALPDLTGQYIQDTFQRIVQVSASGGPSGSIFTDGTGSLIELIDVTASYAISASVEVIKEVSSSYAETASLVIGEGSGSFSGSFFGDGSNLTNVTASYVNPLNQDVFINGDLYVTGSLSSSGSITHTGSINLLSSSISVVDYIDFNNTGITPPPDIEGRIYWDEDNGTLSLGMHGGQVVQQVGLEEYFYIKNQTGDTIPNGSVVRAAGTLGASGRILGDLMIADGSITYYFTLGIATEDIVNGDDGYVTQFGAVRGIDTTGTAVSESWNDGDVLWVSPTTPGGLTKFEPDSPNLKMQMAIVINAASNGTLFVRPDLNSFLTDLHNVNDFTTTSSFGDLLVKSGSTWINTKQLTGSYGLTGSIEGGDFSGSFSGSFEGDGSGLTGLVSSSYAETASYALNSELLDGRDSTTFTSTASFNSFTSSYYTDSASFDTRITNNSSSISILSSSYLDSSASFASDILINSASIAELSGSFLTFTSSYYTDSASFDTRITNNSESISSLSSSFLSFSSSYNTGSFTGSFTGSLLGTASWAENAVTAFNTPNAVITASNIGNDDTIEFLKGGGGTFAVTVNNVQDAVSSSYALTASYVNPLVQNVIITGSVDVLNGNVNLDANSYFFQGTSTGGSNVSLIGVNSSDQIYIGNQGFDNIIADDLAIQGDTTISGSLIVSGSTTNNIQLFLPLTSSNDISSSADIYGRTGSFDYLDVSTNISASGNVTGNTGSFNYLNVEGDTVINGNTTLNGAVSFKTYRLTSSAYTASVDDYRIGVKYTLTGSVEIQLPLIATAGEIEYKFKDEEGNAKKQNITIIASGSDLIDGDRNAILDRNYIAIGIYNDGTSNWFIE